MIRTHCKTVTTSLLIVLLSLTARAEHRVLLHGGGRLAIIETDGAVSWQMKWGGIHDIHVLKNGNILTHQGKAGVAEINPKTKEVVWSYDSSKRNGNAGRRVEVHALERLENGHTMIAESGAGRIIEVDAHGTIHREIKLELDHPDAHSDTRLVRRTPADTYLVAHEADGKVREYDRQSGNVVWEYEVPMFDKEAKGGHGPEAFGNRLFSAIRLENGNTLIGSGNGHSVLEVTPDKQIVWELHQDDLPNIRLAWVTTLEVLRNGNLVIGNCHAGPGQPLLVEVDRKTNAVIWSLDRHADFGNNVSNSLLLDVAGKSIR